MNDGEGIQGMNKKVTFLSTLPPQPDERNRKVQSAKTREIEMREVKREWVTGSGRGIRGGQRGRMT